jgi:CheY-like chemotaxis protein
MRWLGAMVEAPSATNTVLIVEDNDVEREGLSAVLRREGFSVREAETGDAALTALRTARPNLILLDMLLPDSTIDGWALLSYIQQTPQWSHIPIVIVTGLSIASAEWSQAMGALDVIRKPIDTRQLLDKLRRYTA